jgi:hypothetical protein
MGFSGTGKILYKQPSPFLDAEIPKGIYRNDLNEYYSIQNEFPRVYGIGRGNLPSDASDERKSQVLQLQGFLLFFDQLLANYLMQLKNIRFLFALSSSENNNHTYFINELTNVPQLQKLLRFNADVNNSSGQGSILAYPTDRKKFQELMDNDGIKNTELERQCKDKPDFPIYTFCFGPQRDQAVSQLRDDLLLDDYEPIIESNNNECFFFYFFTSSSDFVIISKRYYKSFKEAKNAAASLKYAATLSENYRNFIVNDGAKAPESFSFDIELNFSSYATYLQLIVEDEKLYVSRRQGFLNHLLARFAERFTDYALLTSGFLAPDKLQKAQIKAEEKFLSKYDELSSNRGKAYNYKSNGWNNENVSGFEKRFKALAGIEDWRKHYLCNFVVEEVEKQYQPGIDILREEKLTIETPLNNPTTLASITSIYRKLNDDPLFEMSYMEHEKAWQLFIKDDFQNKYIYNKTFSTKEDAASQTDLLAATFCHKPSIDKNVFVAGYIFKIELTDHHNNVLAEYVGNDKAELTDRNKADAKCIELARRINDTINDPNAFNWKIENTAIGNLIAVNGQEPPFIFINERAFEYYFIEEVNLTEDLKYKFKVRDRNKRFLFESFNKYDNESTAHEDVIRFLPLLANDLNYSIEKNDRNTFDLFINSADAKMAVYFNSFPAQTAAQRKKEEIINEVKSYCYTLRISDPIPDFWKFRFLLNDLSVVKMEYDSEANFPDADSAFDAAKKFYADFADLKARISKGRLTIVSAKENLRAVWNNTTENTEEINAAKANSISLLSAHNRLTNEISNTAEDELNRRLSQWQIRNTENYRYKLVDKDNLIAYHTSQKKILHENDAKNIRNDLVFHATTGYDFIDINVGGDDIICYYTDEKSKLKWYHYRIKCTNLFYRTGTSIGKELVLFESAKGYATKEEAQNAFNKNYLLILRYGQRAENYGDDKYISFKETLMHGDEICQTETVVFIPKETMDEFGGYEVQKELIPLVKSYPIKYITKEKYRFYLFNKHQDHYDWRSVSAFTTAKETMQHFQFFLVLLSYPGNFYIENDATDCRYHVYIREVLAESAHGFNTCEDAWGKDGVEKFICVSQTENSFHPYFKRKDCSHSFFVACANTGLIHPCNYETLRRQEDMLNTLYQASSFNFFNCLSFENNKLVLLDLNKNEIASIFVQRDNERNQDFICQRLIAFFEAVYIDKNYIDQNGNLYLQNGKGHVIAEPALPETSLEEWKKQLLKMACYFPIVRRNNANQPLLYKYFVEIKLPGFGKCEDDLIGNDCDCGSDEDDCTIGCYLAWKSECCFDTCCDALQFYFIALQLISKYENYKRIYECGCGSYGIELHPENIMVTGSVLRSVRAEVERIAGQICPSEIIGRHVVTNLCVNEIVAINPQQYTDEKMACEAIERAKKLINSEGLHLTEHILLRPHCKNVDGRYIECECEALPRPCINPDTFCQFEWKPGGELDPCGKDKKLCFTPGFDAYSFIATVALPAWPQRFRSKENRAVIEKLLQREAPAHVLLRILWMNPRDFCCFEYYYKRWNEWLAKKLCAEGYNNCDFLEFLFRKNFAEISKCDECQPCKTGPEPLISCSPDDNDPCREFNLTQKLNELFCWNRDDWNYEFKDCEPCNEHADFMRRQLHGEEVAEHPEVEEASEVVPDSNGEEEETEQSEDIQQKLLLIQSRAELYRRNIFKVFEESSKSKAAEDAMRFMEEAQPTPELFNDLTGEIIKSPANKTKNMQGLNKTEKQILIKNLSWKYLDFVCFNEIGIEKIVALRDTFTYLRENKINMDLIYKDWKSDEVKQFEPLLDFKEIRSSLTGK